MKRCAWHKDRILTDYFDGELDMKIKEQVDAHLYICSSCRRFAETVQKDLVSPFLKIQAPAVSERVWLAIKERIEAERVRQPEEPTIIDVIRQALLSMRSVGPILAGIAVILVVAGVFYSQQNAQNKKSGSGEHVGYLLESTGILWETEHAGSKIPLEEYFL